MSQSLSTPSEQDAPDICCLCLERLDIPGFGCQRLSCGHTMHEQCITELRSKSGSDRCPLCAQSHDDLLPVQAFLSAAVVQFLRKAYPESKQLILEAIEVDPMHVEANLFLADFYSRYAAPPDHVRAIECLQTAHQSGSIAAAMVCIHLMWEVNRIHLCSIVG